MKRFFTSVGTGLVTIVVWIIVGIIAIGLFAFSMTPMGCQMGGLC